MAWASLPMYDLPECRAATDAWWAALAGCLRAAGIAAPERLGEGAGPPLLTQTCGYPLTHAQRGRYRLVATPCYRAAGCEGPCYRSAILVRGADPAQGLADLRGRTAAVNAWDLHSGMNALRHAVAPLAEDGRFFGAVVETGSHRASLAAVREGRADVAAADPVTFAMLGRHASGETAGLRVLAWSAPAPGLPYVTDAAAPDWQVWALRTALAAADAGARRALLIDRFEALDRRAYDRILRMEAEAAAAGYPELA